MNATSEIVAKLKNMFEYFCLVNLINNKLNNVINKTYPTITVGIPNKVVVSGIFASFENNAHKLKAWSLIQTDPDPVCKRLMYTSNGKLSIDELLLNGKYDNQNVMIEIKAALNIFIDPYLEYAIHI